ncbi:MAG: hypothetical protein FWH38_03260 [Treponema sp.]|nr:hypothetical protein [Treponema sp.]
MKKIMPGLICMLFVLSCEIPQSLTIKGNPGVYLPLGSPFASLDQDDRLESKISPASIREMMNKSVSETSTDRPARIYDYQLDSALGSQLGIDPATQTYLIHYPIVSMQLDLMEYVDDAMSDYEDNEPATYVIPAAIANIITQNIFDSQYPSGCFLTLDGPKTSPGDPLFSVNLSDMYKLVYEVNGERFGIQIGYSATFEQNIMVRIPALGIGGSGPNDYQKGVKDGDKLVFYNPAKTTFSPADLGEGGMLEIYVKLTGPCSGTINPEMVFIWTSAEIDTSGKNLSGSYPVENSLGEFLGQGVDFKKVEGYIYVDGAGDGGTITLKAGSNDILSDSPLTQKPSPVFQDPYTKKLPDSSLNAPIDLLGLLNSGGSVLEYEINIPTMTINNSNTSEVITADLVILLPLELEITTPASGAYANTYVKLDLEDLFPDPGDGDLFMRESQDNGLLNNLDYVKIIIINPNITVIDMSRLAVLVTAKNYSNIIDFSLASPYLQIDFKDLPYPFSPKFEILLKRDGGSGSPGTFRITRPAQGKEQSFNFSLAVEARANIDYTIDFTDMQEKE